MCQGEFVVGDKCVVGHLWLIYFWLIHRTDAIFLPLTRARGGEGYDEAAGKRPSRNLYIRHQLYISLTYIINVKQFCVKYKIINDDNYFMLGMHIY